MTIDASQPARHGTPPAGGAPAPAVPWRADGLWTDTDLLRVTDLRTHFGTREGVVRAVDGIDLSVQAGRTLCIVGETGSGKSITGRSIMRLVDAPGRIVSGKIRWRRRPDAAEWIDLADPGVPDARIRALRGRDIGMVFQEPMAALSPMYTVGAQFVEAVRVHETVTRQQAWARGIAALERVGIADPASCMNAYPFQLSGGMCQRAMIAIALCCSPALLIADEPTTALDVTTQARILDLLVELQQQNGMAMIFITHDMGVVAEMADTIAVMRDGRIVEYGTSEDIFRRPAHSYTSRLLRASHALIRDVPAGPAGAAPASAGPPPQADAPRSDAPILEVADLLKAFGARGRHLFRRAATRVLAVDKVSFAIAPGEIFGLVGESGSGKTTVGRCVTRAIAPTSGTIRYRRADGTVIDVSTLGDRQLRPIRQEIRLILQDPFTSLNPRMTVLDLIGEPLRVNRLASGSELDDRVAEMMQRVGLNRDHLRRYPHAFSGGQRQRINIARALITRPRLVVADESVSALDVSVREQVLDLMKSLQQEMGLTYLFISHDLSVVSHMCDRVAVMLRGEIVETLPAAQLFAPGRHPYTAELAAAVPVPDPDIARKRRPAGPSS